MQREQNSTGQGDKHSAQGQNSTGKDKKKFCIRYSVQVREINLLHWDESLLGPVVQN